MVVKEVSGGTIEMIKIAVKCIKEYNVVKFCDAKF